MPFFEAGGNTTPEVGETICCSHLIWEAVPHPGASNRMDLFPYAVVLTVGTLAVFSYLKL